MTLVASLASPPPLALAASSGVWSSIGLGLALIGGFLLANAALFLAPRAHVGERLRGARPMLRSIRNGVFLRVQTGIGFVFLLAGFGVQLVAQLAEADGSPGAAELPLWAGGVVLALVVIEIAGWWLSHALFRRALREHFLAEPPDFETDTPLAREVGALFDMKTRADETVSSYAERLRRELRLPAPGRRGPALTADLDDDEDE